MRILCATVLVGCLVTSGRATADQSAINQAAAVQAAAVEAAIVEDITKKALPAIVAGANEWMADNDCVSCHRVTHAAWALNLAANQKVSSVTAQQRLQINQWSTDWTKVANPKVRAEAVQAMTLQNDADTAAQALLGLAAVEDRFDEDWAKAYHSAIIAGQQPEGFWKAAGQLPLQKRELRETQEVTTMWALVALKVSQLPNPKQDRVKDKATEWLKSKGSVTAGKSTEWWALNSLLVKSYDDAAPLNSAKATLLSFQNADGGWGWLVDEESDALGTGIALYALATSSSPEAAKARSNAIEFLSTTQLADGSWDVRGTKKSGRNEVAETASYWGSCWAVIGLLQQR